MNIDDIKADIAKAFAQHLGISGAEAADLLPISLSAGKVYEAFILGAVCEILFTLEGCTLRLRGGNKLVLKTSPGPINRNYPWIEVERDGAVVVEIFTDIEFLSMSYSNSGGRSLTNGDYHEIDIALVKPDASGRPRHDQIIVAIECKNAVYQKGMLKEILGVRRELSLLAPKVRTMFQIWPMREVPADPPSCVVVYSSSAAVLNYKAPGDTFGILFQEKPLQ